MRRLALAAAFLAATAARGAALGVWANDGGEKIPREELRLARGTPVTSMIWDGAKVSLSGARNETVGFALVLEAPDAALDVRVQLDELHGKSGAIRAKAPPVVDGKPDLFDFRGRDIELFALGYLKIKGLSRMSYDDYDERHIPKRLQRPWTADGRGHGKWEDRPDAGKSYPDICVPLELRPRLHLARGTSQAVWVDVYVPKGTKPGLYTGTIEISGGAKRAVPVALEVTPITLPDRPSAKTMVYLGSDDVNQRYFGTPHAADAAAAQVRDRHFQLARRHRFSLIDADPGEEHWDRDEPRPEWIPRLDGSLFTARRHYAGPGEGLGTDVYSIGTYGNWAWKTRPAPERSRHADGWVSWFRKNFPAVTYFLYLIDESSDYAATEKLAAELKQNGGPGADLRTFATLPLDKGVALVPSLDIYAGSIQVAERKKWQDAFDRIHAEGKSAYMYNGGRPASGSLAIEDDGVALRELAWVQYKKQIDRWFIWESTYYHNYQGHTGQTNVFRTAQTIGQPAKPDPVLGETSDNYNNGDGVLFYPGTDRVYPEDSLEVPGPLASLRMKLWRRGLQDVDYLTLAAKVDPVRTQKIVERMVPLALWDYGIDNPKNPTYRRADISWSIRPDDWERARRELAAIILGGRR